MKRTKYIIGLTAITALSLSCTDFLDRRPVVNPAPEDYFSDESQLLAYIDGCYPIMPSHGDHGDSHVDGWDFGIYGDDNGTDNQVSASTPDRFLRNSQADSPASILPERGIDMPRSHGLRMQPVCLQSFLYRV